MRTLVALLALVSIAEARPPRLVPDVGIGKLTYEPASRYDDSGTVRAAKERFLTCYKKGLSGFGFPSFEASFKIVLPITATGSVGPPTVSRETGPDNPGVEATQNCIAGELRKLRFARGTARKPRFPITLHLAKR